MATRGWEQVTSVEAARMGRKPATVAPVTRSKYGARKTWADGILFSSKGEARRYGLLRDWQAMGFISDLELQPEYPLIVAGITIGKYIADFRYYKADGELVVEDFKGMPTPVYRLKKRIVEAFYGFKVTEIR